MEIYVVIKNIDDYPECGGGDYPDAVFLNYTNAERYVKQKQQETKIWERYDKEYTTWRIETWETADEEENTK